jgi:NADH-quinone oxidoreductase subunit N
VGAASQFFTPADYVLALPILLLTLFAIGILLIDLMLPAEWKWLNAFLAVVGVAFATVGVIQIQRSFQQVGSPMVRLGFMNLLIVDRLAIFFFYLFLAGTAVAILMSVKYLEVERESHGEYFALMLFSVVGMMCMAAGFDIVLIFIGLELMAISTYVLVGFLRRDRRSNEAALKYFLLGAFSSGIFAYGLSLFYGVTGSTNLFEIGQLLKQRIAVNSGHADPIIVIALLTTAVGLFFKIAAIPFHQWAPDAYEGAPSSITGFMSVAVKAAGWAMLLRIIGCYPFIIRGQQYWPGLFPLRPIYVPLMIFVSIATMTGANLAALTQTNLKRLLAYSSIAHVGYMLLGLIAGTSTSLNPDGVKGILIYLLVYTFMNLGAFAVITSLAQRKTPGDEIDDIAGLYFRRPVEAILMLIFLLSLAGIPPLAGFWGKYFIFLSLVSTGHYTLAALAVLYTVLGLYYYLRIANAMFVRQPLDPSKLEVSFGMRLALGISALATVAIGIYPNPFIELVNWSLGLAPAQPLAHLLH